MPISAQQPAPPTYAELVEQAIARIPSLAPTWTDHNPSDPGIMLIELFAWLSEMLHYRIDTIPEAHYWAFLALLNDTRATNNNLWQARQNLPLGEAIRQTITELRTPYRAVTAADYEYLVLQEWQDQPQATKIARVRCIVGYNLETYAASDGHISLVIMPSDQRKNLQVWLDTRRLLGTVLHVLGPQFVTITISATIHLRADYSLLINLQGTSGDGITRKQLATTDGAITDAAKQQAIMALVDYFDPQKWPFGRGVYRSEIYRLLDTLPGVAYVEAVVITATDHRAATLYAIPLAEYELVNLNATNITLYAEIPTAD
jgi:hypothetical protein